MKLQLKKKNMKTLIDNKAISSNMTPQVAGGKLGPRPTDLTEKCNNPSMVECKFTAMYGDGYTCIER